VLQENDDYSFVKWTMTSFQPYHSTKIQPGQTDADPGQAAHQVPQGEGYAMRA
jgi:hypothetical protein